MSRRAATRTADPIRALSVCVLVLMGLSVLALPGCSCREETPAERAAREAREAEEERKRREEELAQLDWLLAIPTVQPGSFESPTLSPKPGHWNGVTQPIRPGANNKSDFDGEMQLSIVDKQGDPLPLDRTPFRLVTKRPVVVAQQSSKDVDSWFFYPTGEGSRRLRSVIRERRGGALMQDTTTPVRALLDHQYHFVVLAKEPERYAFLNSLYSVTSNLPQSIDLTTASKGAMTVNADKNYRLIAMPLGDGSRAMPLPDNPLAWTSIAYLLWDEVDPQSLRAEQRDAMVDWINWGGQLLVSGPDSLDLLKGSFLEPLLPATPAGAREIDDDQLQQVASRWSAASQTSGKPLTDGDPWTGVTLSLAEQGAWLPGLDGLLAERRVGRGRVVVSGFQLAQRALVNWSDGVDNLYNAALLRRDPRSFVRDSFEGNRPVALWTEKPTISPDPLRNTSVRMFARDLYKEPQRLSLTLAAEDFGPANNNPGMGRGFAPPVESSLQMLKPPAVRGGIGAWNDENLVSKACRAALRQSAGVSVPGAGFVMICLATYLVLLAPINWFFFQALGRVELAWVAAPLLALAGAWVVVRQAQLDIGFVRSQTEIAILETQPDTTRGVLTRYNALYTSLSTTYDLEFDHGMAFAAPFPRLGLLDGAQRYDQISEAVYDRQEKARLNGLAVSSASTEFVLSEEMIDLAEHPVPGSSLPGRIAINSSNGGAHSLINQTEWLLEHVAVVRRPDGVDGPALLEGCWIGRLDAGDSGNVAFSRIVAAQGDAAPFAEEREQAEAVSAAAPTELDLEPLYRLALDATTFEPGESRVVALAREPMPGLTITPAASQRNHATLVVGRLAYGPLPPPQSDKNAPSDVQ